MEDFRNKMEIGTSSIRGYLDSIQVRDDTKACLLIGVCMGMAVVAVITAFPGKPIDYGGVGFNLPPGMQGESNANAANKQKKDDNEEPDTIIDSSAVHQQSGGLRDIQAVVGNLSELRRRRNGRRTISSSSSPAHEGNLTESRERSQQEVPGEDGKSSAKIDAAKIDAAGDWDASRLDEDRLAKKIGSSKAARMLGLTEEQVRQAVLDAKEEMQQSREEELAGSGSSPRGDNNDDDNGLGLSGLISLVFLVVGLAALWLYLATHPYAPIARFLAGLFPREMSVLGLASEKDGLPARHPRW